MDLHTKPILLSCIHVVMEKLPFFSGRLKKTLLSNMFIIIVPQRSRHDRDVLFLYLSDKQKYVIVNYN